MLPSRSPPPCCAALIHIAFQVGGRSYAYYRARLDWASARDVCKGAGMRLARLDSYDQSWDTSMQIWHRAASSSGVYVYWIGGSDAAEEGVWRWTDGQQLSYSRWDWVLYEPFLSPYMNCMWANAYWAGYWYAKPCSEKVPFLCSAPGELEGCWARPRCRILFPTNDRIHSRSFAGCAA